MRGIETVECEATLARVDQKLLKMVGMARDSYAYPTKVFGFVRA